MSLALGQWRLAAKATSPQVAARAAGPLRIESLSRQGGRGSENQDAYLVLAEARLFAVADGMGGHAGGRIASRLAIDTLYQAMTAVGTAVSVAAIEHAIERGHQRIRHAAVSDARLGGMGSTLVVAWWEGQRLHCFHVGDSRAYRWRDYRLAQLTADHSAPAARAGGRKGALLRALGAGAALEVDYACHAWCAGDGLLLCSDGISDVLAGYRISNLLASRGEGEGVASPMIDQAERLGGRDDKTVVWVEEGVA